MEEGSGESRLIITIAARMLAVRIRLQSHILLLATLSMSSTHVRRFRLKALSEAVSRTTIRVRLDNAEGHSVQ